MDTSWCLPEFRLGDTFDRFPAPSLWLVRWGKAEEEEARRIKQRIHECNEASQDQWRGIHSSTHIPIPNHGWASSTDAKNSCTLFHEWAIREASKAIRLWISYWRVILWSLCGPHGEASWKDGDWGNDISCSRADQYGRKLRFKDFCRHPDVALPEGFKRPKFSKYNGISYHHLLSFCGDCRGLDSQSGLFFHLYHKSLEGEALK